VGRGGARKKAQAVTSHLLDTNILGYFVRAVDPALTRRVAWSLEREQAAISVITRAEMRYGQALMAATDKRRKIIDLLLDQVPVLPWTTAAADQYGHLKALLKRKGVPIGEMDTQIAAHAVSEGLILVTHNTRHFKRVPGLGLEDWTA
jgi:tRNA(fMet)-specific endonuclease VapC